VTNKPNRKIILGLGNTLNKDEGLGVHALKSLELLLGEIEELEFVDGGVLGLNLLPWVEESSHLLIIDAINAGKEPGSVIEMTGDQIPMYTGIKMSDHQITFQEVLGLAKFREKLPLNLHLIGAQPIDLAIGLDLSPQIESKIPEIVKRAENHLSDWGLLD